MNRNLIKQEISNFDKDSSRPLNLTKLLGSEMLVKGDAVRMSKRGGTLTVKEMEMSCTGMLRHNHIIIAIKVRKDYCQNSN